MTEIRSEIDDFHTRLETLYNSTLKDTALAGLQAAAWEQFCKVGLPTRKNEVFRYVKLGQLYNQVYVEAKPVSLEKEVIETHIYPECKESVLVFVNGHFTPELSRILALPKKMIVLRLSEAMRTYGSLLTNQIGKSIKEELDPFALLNLALHGEGLFLYLPPKTVCTVPVQILHVVDSRIPNPFVAPRMQVFAGASTEIEIFSSHAFLSSLNGFINQRTDISLEENAHVRYVQANFHESADQWHFDALRATLKKSATLKSIGVTTGSKTVRNDYRATLIGEQSEVSLSGVWMLEERRETHQHIFIDHQAPNCLSRQLFKGVLNDAGHSSFEGKIMVRQAAQETNAFQLNRNLLLSDGATAESKPNLEIFADSVKASHGATIGQLEKEELFYMQSRGFPVADAKRLLVHGFCQEVLDLIGQPEVRKQIGTRFYARPEIIKQETTVQPI